MRPSTYEKELALNTDSKFPAERRGDVAKLRIQASQIGNVRRGILWNHRMRTAVPPLSWIDSKVEAPVTYPYALAFPLAVKVMDSPGFPFPAMGKARA